MDDRYLSRAWPLRPVGVSEAEGGYLRTVVQDITKIPIVHRGP